MRQTHHQTCNNNYSPPCGGIGLPPICIGGGGNLGGGPLGNIPGGPPGRGGSEPGPWLRLKKLVLALSNPGGGGRAVEDDNKNERL